MILLVLAAILLGGVAWQERRERKERKRRRRTFVQAWRRARDYSLYW